MPEDGLEHSRRVHAEIGAHLDRLRRFILPIFLKSPKRFLLCEELWTGSNNEASWKSSVVPMDRLSTGSRSLTSIPALQP